MMPVVSRLSGPCQEYGGGMSESGVAHVLQDLTKLCPFDQVVKKISAACECRL
jgi:hypothetical protein